MSWFTFYCATQICIARTCYGDVAGWLGGCPSHAGIVSKGLNPVVKLWGNTEERRSPSVFGGGTPFS